MAIFEEDEWPGFRSKRKILKPLLQKVHEETASAESVAVNFHPDLQTGLMHKIIALEIVSLFDLHNIKVSNEDAENAVSYCAKMPIKNCAQLPLVNIARILLQESQNGALEKKLLFAWQGALFPSGFHGLNPIALGKWRKNHAEEGYNGEQKINGPKASRLKSEMEKFLAWAKNDTTVDPYLRTATSHLWFLALSPFDFGNSFLVHSLHHFMLRKSMNTIVHPMITAIALKKKEYFEILNSSIENSLEISAWLEWYLNTALESNHILQEKLQSYTVIAENSIESLGLSQRQQEALGALQLKGKARFSTGEYATLAKVSNDTALRDIKNLIDKNVLASGTAGGRSTYYSFLNERP